MNLKPISMIKLIKIFSFLFFLGAGSFLLFQSDKAQKKAEDWVGKYELSTPNFIEKSDVGRKNNERCIRFCCKTKTFSERRYDL